MRRQSVLLFSFFLTGSVFAAPDFRSVFEDVPEALPSSVQIKGGVAEYPTDELSQLREALKEAVRVTHALAPGWQKRHFFGKGPAEGAERRRLVIVLTDRPEVPIGAYFHSNPFQITTIAPIYPTEDGLTQTFYVVFRADQILYHPDGSFRKDAFFSLLTGLLVETYGYGSWMLEHSLSDLGRIEDEKKVKGEILRRKIRVIEELLNNPKAFVPVGMGPLRAKLFKTLVDLCDQLTAETGTYEGPWVFPFEMTIGAMTNENASPGLREEIETTLFWAFSLVRALPPEGAPVTVFQGGPGLRESWQSRFRLKFQWLDLREQAIRVTHPSNAALLLPWMRSDIVTAQTRDSPMFFQSLWTDRSIYSPDTGALRPDRLANTAMTLAADLYGWVQPYLVDATHKESLVGSAQAKRTGECLREGVAFCDRLTQTPWLWDSLSREQQEGFYTVRAAFAKQARSQQESCEELLREEERRKRGRR